VQGCEFKFQDQKKNQYAKMNKAAIEGLEEKLEKI
jgi:hypothetical protein